MCHVYFFSACCSSKNSRSSNAMLQVSLDARNGTHHNSFALLLLFFASYFFPSGLAPRRENMACPTLLKGLHLNPSSTATEAVSMLSTRRTPLDSSLRSYTVQYLVSRPRFSLRSCNKNCSVSSTGPGNQATTLLQVRRASRPTILSLEPSQATRVCTLAAN